MPRRKRDRDPHQQWLESLHPALRILAEWPHWEDLSGGTLVVACSGGRDSVALAHAAWTLLKGPEAVAFAGYVTARALPRARGGVAAAPSASPQSPGAQDALLGARAAGPHAPDYEDVPGDKPVVGPYTLPELVLWHYDHGLRDDSGEDAEFVRQLGTLLGVEVAVDEGRLREHPEFGRKNTAALARESRYSALTIRLDTTGVATGEFSLAGLLECRQAFLAHHLQDQAETILFNLVRGSGHRGLLGMGNWTGQLAAIHRPWLRFDPSEIADYAITNTVTWLEDPTNSSLETSRGLIRHRVIPLMAEINPAAVRHIAQASDHLREALRCTPQSNSPPQEDVIDLPVEELPRPLSSLMFRLPLLALPNVQRAAFHLGNTASVSERTWAVLECLNTIRSRDDSAGSTAIRKWLSDTTQPLQLSDACLYLHGDLLELELPRTRRGQDVKYPVELPLFLGHDLSQLVDCEVFDPPTPLRSVLEASGAIRFANWHDWLSGLPTADPWEMPVDGEYSFFTAAFDTRPEPVYVAGLPPDTDFPLFLRTWHRGDRIRLSAGMTKMVSDVFIDAKVPRSLRDSWILLTNATDEVLWVAGLANGLLMRRAAMEGVGLAVAWHPQLAYRRLQPQREPDRLLVSNFSFA